MNLSPKCLFWQLNKKDQIDQLIFNVFLFISKANGNSFGEKFLKFQSFINIRHYSPF